MKFPKEVNTYCPYCASHQIHKAKAASKGAARTLAAGTRSHNRSLTGHGSKRKGKQTPKKQGKMQKITLQCPKCNKKQERIVGKRTTKKIEFKQ